MWHRVWKGVIGDDRMYYSSSSDGLTWTDQREIVGRTSHGPALVQFKSRLHRAWKGAGDDMRIYYSSSGRDGLAWTDPQPVGAPTTHSPELAVYNDTLYLAYKSLGAGMYMSSLSADGKWSTPRRIAGRTSQSPALSAARIDPRLYCVWKGEGTDTRMFLSSSANPDYPDEGGTHIWLPPQQVGGQTSHGPALTLGPGGLHRLWKNNADDTMMISSGMPYSSGIQWSASRRIPGVTSDTPSLVSF